MKAVGYAVVIAALFIGAGIVSNLLSRMSREECARQCPQNPAALKRHFEIAGFELVQCNCGEVKQ
jgi:hypothetical protein